MSLDKDKVSLLTLSREDLKPSTKMNATSSNKEDELVLMQMPSSSDVSSVKELLHNAKIIAPTTSHQACLIVEEKGVSFEMSRVETSNALVLVPPTFPTDTTNAAASDDDEPRPNKKTKFTTKDGIQLDPVKARLLQPGGSGASFLELRKRSMSVKELNRLLQEHVLDPYQEEGVDQWQGRTLQDLAVELQCSEKEVSFGLDKLQTFRLTRDDVVLFGLLSEEALQEATSTIVATLLECDEFSDYACRGVNLEKCVKEALSRVSDQDMHRYMPQVLRHTLQSLVVVGENDGGVQQNDDTVLLDFQKIAVCAARRLLRNHPNPFQLSDFLEQWQRETPGVGSSYEVSAQLLSGVAFPTDKKKGEWKYLPEDKLPLDPKERLEQLFQARDKWTKDEMSPFLSRIIHDTSVSELLLNHCRTASEEIDGKTKTFYLAKR